MATNINNTAQQEYTKRAGDIARLIDVLQMELERHAKQAREDQKNFGRVGDLGKVRSDLIETVSFISGNDRETVEAFLAE